MHALSRATAALLGTALVACSPTMDWREIRPEGSQARLMFPCKPASHARKVRLATRDVEMTLHACTAGEATYALAFADLADPAAVTPALDELARSAATNLQPAEAPASSAHAVAGMTPNAAAARWRIEGRLPDGRPVREDMALFAYGTRVYQATVIGARADAASLETFFSSLRVGG